jgi:GGDEF domain-containing protein
MTVNNIKIRQNNRTGEASFGATIIAAICIVIYLFALVQATVRVYLSIDNQKVTADMEFRQIADIALIAGSHGFMNEAFVETLYNALLFNNTIEALIISGPDGEYAFERQKDHAVTWVNNSPRFIKKFGFARQAHFRPLPLPNLRNVNIHGIARTFDYVEITKILKETLILILIGFTLAFFTMLIQLLRTKPAEILAQSLPEEKQENETAAQAEQTEKIVEKAEEPVSIIALNGPKGLYSPRSNIGWEEYTNDRLNSELHRCASTEKDLTLLAIDFEENLNDVQFRQAAEEVVSFFTSRDLLFERGKQGINVICPGIDLETGLDKAQKFQSRIKEKIFFNHRADDCIFIGLSSRAGRLLNASRLLMETNEALLRAKTDRDTSIIAFKSNLDKYRKFIASQSPGRS